MKNIVKGSIVTLRNDLRDLEYYGLCAWFKEYNDLRGKQIAVDKVIDVIDDKKVYTLVGVSNNLLVTEEMVEDVINDFKCQECGCEIVADDIIMVNGKPMCRKCANEKFDKCSVCGELLIDDIITLDDGSAMCRKCFNEKYFKDSHGNIHLKSDGYEVDGKWLTADELKQNTFECEKCHKRHLIENRIYHSIDICEKCMDNISNPIRCYHDYEEDFWDEKVTQEDNNGVPMFTGFELEVERVKGDMSRKVASYITNVLSKGLVVFENDGSLNDSGFEIISHPMTLNFIHSKFDTFKTMLKALSEIGYGSTSDTGFHVHVNREYLGAGTRNIDDVINNIAIILETFQKELCKFANRSSNGYCQFLTDGNGKKTLKFIKRARKNKRERYLVLNETNENTIEFRIFKSTVDYETFMATLEFVHNVVNIAKKEDINGLTWSDIISYNNGVNKFIVGYNDKLGIQSDNQISILTNIELNKENYSFKKFLNGEFAMQMYDDYEYSKHSKYFVGNLLANGVKYHNVYSNMEECLYRKCCNNQIIKVKYFNGVPRLISDTDGVLEVQDFMEVYDLWCDNIELFKS